MLRCVDLVAKISRQCVAMCGGSINSKILRAIQLVGSKYDGMLDFSKSTGRRFNWLGQPWVRERKLGFWVPLERKTQWVGGVFSRRL